MTVTHQATFGTLVDGDTIGCIFAFSGDAGTSVSTATTSSEGKVELATTAETVTGTDTARVVTPAGLHGALAGLTDTTVTASDTFVFSDATDSGNLKEDTVQGIIDLVGPGGAGYFLGGASGATGDTSAGLEDIFRVNSATVDNSCTIATTTNASATGPLTVSSGVTVTVEGVLAVI